MFFHMRATVTITVLPHRTTMDPLCDAHRPSMPVDLRFGKGRVGQGGGKQPPRRPTSDPAAAFAATSLDFNLQAQQSGLKTAQLMQTCLMLNTNASHITYGMKQCFSCAIAYSFPAYVCLVCVGLSHLLQHLPRYVSHHDHVDQQVSESAIITGTPQFACLFAYKTAASSCLITLRTLTF